MIESDYDGKKSSAAVLREKKKKRPDWTVIFWILSTLFPGAALLPEIGRGRTGSGQPNSGNRIQRRSSKLQHCLDIGCLREQLKVPSGERHELCRGLHAEQNAIIQAALHGVSTKGSTLYCTNHPCVICAKMIINAGIIRVVIRDGYHDQLAAEMLKEAGIRVEQL